jgi:hypothetical protein
MSASAMPGSLIRGGLLHNGWLRYLVRRALQGILLLLGVSVLTFLFSALAPGKYLDEMRLNPQI